MSDGCYMVVITGGRDYPHDSAVYGLLNEELAIAHDWSRPGSAALNVPRAFYVLHGDCPTGADRAARMWARRVGCVALPMQAQWDTEGKAAGPIRNNRLATVARCFRDCGWIVRCHAFPGGAGTRSCIQALEAAGFEVAQHE